MDNKLVGQLAIVAGVFIMLGGFCFGIGFAVGGIPFQGLFTLVVGFVLIVAGARMVRSSKDSENDG